MTKLIRDIRRKQRFALYFPSGYDITVTFDENRNPGHCFDESSLPFIETLVEDKITFLGQIKNLGNEGLFCFSYNPMHTPRKVIINADKSVRLTRI